MSVLYFKDRPFYFKGFLIYSERVGMQAEGGAERERETQNLKQAPGSELSAHSPTRGLNPRTVRS